MLYKILLVVDVVLAVGIILLVLLQRGKGAETGAAFGGGASGTVFGSQGSSSFLSRTTAVLATLWFLDTLALGYLVTVAPAEPESVLERATAEEVVAPAVDEGDAALPTLEADEPAADGELPSVPEADADGAQDGAEDAEGDDAAGG